MAFQNSASADSQNRLLTPVNVRDIASLLGVKPTKTLGQNFVHDAGTVRRIVRDAQISAGDRVLEIGPGLGSLTLALLEVGAVVSAVEIDPLLARQLPVTIAQFMPDKANNFALVNADAMQVKAPTDLAIPPSLATATPANFMPQHLVANLPYNVAVPILLTLFAVLPSLETATVMVQSEVAERLAAPAGSRTYGIPSVKAAWYAEVQRGAKISRNVFWPVPNVDSALVHFSLHAVPEGVNKDEVFTVVDAAFAQRRKTLRAALANWAGSPARAETILLQAGIDPKLRGEKLVITDFIKIARVAENI